MTRKSSREGVHLRVWLTDPAVQQKLTQHREATLLQKKKKKVRHREDKLLVYGDAAGSGRAGLGTQVAWFQSPPHNTLLFFSRAEEVGEEGCKVQNKVPHVPDVSQPSSPVPSCRTSG